MKTIIIFVLTTLLFSFNSFSQSYNRRGRSADILANPDRSFNNRNQQSVNQKTPQFQSKRKMLPLSDSTFLISGKVLINLKANAYKLVFGLSQEAVTSKGCNDTINARIENFIKDLGKIGIDESDIYVDMVTQNIVYDYELERKTATQVLRGYEIKKNVIVRFENLENIKELIDLAATHKIYDAMNIEYILDDVEAVYNQLFEETLAIINKKKELYSRALGVDIKEGLMIYSEQFQFITPPQRYRSYSAFESNIAQDWKRVPKVRKEAKSRDTFYYDGLDYSGFDKYINPDKVTIDLQAMFELQIKYERKRN